MASDTGSAAAKGKRAGKRGQTPSAGNEASRVGIVKQEIAEIEDIEGFVAPPSKKRRSGAADQVNMRKVPIYMPSNSPSKSLSRSSRNRNASKQDVLPPLLLSSPASVLANAGGSQNKTTAPKPAEEWGTDDLTRLIENLLTTLPKADNAKYSTQVDRIDWNKVGFSNHSPDECKEKWNIIMTKLRRYRTLTELVLDAKEWIKHPWMSHNNAKGKPKHPDLPKKPLTPYFRYFLEKREKYSKENPDMSMTELAKLLAKKFAGLPDKKKQKYKDSYEKENALYKASMEKFRAEHPDLFPEVESRSRMPAKQNGPHKPQTPLQLFLADKMNKHLSDSGNNKKELEEKYKLQWKNLSDSKRVRWIKKAMADSQRYTLELNEYCLTHPDYKPDSMKSAISKAEKEIKDRSDGKPERPPNSGYSLYSKIMLKELKDIPSKEKMAEISRRWKELADEERQSYDTQAREAVERYQTGFKLYLASLPEEERKKAEEDTKKKKKPATVSVSKPTVMTPKNSIVHEPTESTPTKPKKPMSALFFYQQEKLTQYKVKNPDKSEQELTRQIAREYNELSDKKKEKYKKLAEEAKKTHEQTTTTKEIEIKNKVFKGEPKKPPQSGYSLFTSEMIPKLTDFEPKLRMAEISKRWSAMTNADKEKYKKKTTDLQKKYTKEIQKFLLTLNEDEQKLYKQMKAKKPIRRKTTKVAAPVVEHKSSSSSDESTKKATKHSSSSGSGTGSESGSSSESEESDSGSNSDSNSDASGSEKDDSDSDDDDNAKTLKPDEEKDDSANSSSDESGSQSGSGGSASESDSDEE